MFHPDTALFGPSFFYGHILFSVSFLSPNNIRNIADIDWKDVTEYAPAVLAAVLMPLTFSIAHGIALGFIAYAVIKALSGRHEDLNMGSITIAVISAIYFLAV